MYKIAGELTPFVMHVAARTVATHALSIFGDHSDVMACRATGFAMLAANSPQEAHDLAAVAHAATLRSRVPFLHFFDGFRTSHELQKVRHLSDDDLRALFGQGFVREHLKRGLTPDRPMLRGTARTRTSFSRRARRETRSIKRSPISCRRRWTRSPSAPVADTGSSTMPAQVTPTT